MSEAAKAYIYQNYEGEMSIVFATSRGQAKSAIMYSDIWDEEPYIEIEVKRVPGLDYLNYPNGYELDWNDMEHRRAIMKVLTITFCDGVYDIEVHCKTCSCNDICDVYKDYLEDLKK